MMRSSVDLPEPLRPITPILAPGKNDREMSFKISRLGGTTLPTRFIVYMYCAMIDPLVGVPVARMRGIKDQRKKQDKTTTTQARSAARAQGIPCWTVAAN